MQCVDHFLESQSNPKRSHDPSSSVAGFHGSWGEPGGESEMGRNGVTRSRLPHPGRWGSDKIAQSVNQTHATNFRETKRQWGRNCRSPNLGASIRTSLFNKVFLLAFKRLQRCREALQIELVPSLLGHLISIFRHSQHCMTTGNGIFAPD